MLLWRGTGEGQINDKGTLEHHAYHADVIALRNGTGSGWKELYDRIGLILEGGDFWSDTGHCLILLCAVT